mgnify:FL=1
MAEIRAVEDKYVNMVPRFELPKDYDKPASETKPVTPAPTEVKPPEEAKPAPKAETPPIPKELLEPDPVEEKETLGKDPESTPDPVRAMQRRIDRATRARAEAQTRAETLERELADLRQKSAPTAPSSEPKMEDYTDIKEYAKAFAEFEKANAIKDYEKKQSEKQQQQAVESLVSQWNDKVSRAEDKYDDYREVVGDLKPTTPWAVALMEEENGEEIAYYLGKHIKEAQKIFSMNPLAQAREIGKLSVKISQEKVAPKQPSKAPAPITPVTGNSAAPAETIREGQSFEDYRKIGNKMFRQR